ncbi:unnamed protein product [Brassicogethes aeneus]|uniref:guanylate cyclase n=1 Tax=Brassicogethes aeneus TaxID=1431903 RepID=A0A9P0FLV8_BRAAE|nr:unnamed protein product [Brassicogethes aeneus]
MRKRNKTGSYIALQIEKKRFRLLHHGADQRGECLKEPYWDPDFHLCVFQVAKHFYHKEMKIELVREELLFDMVHVTFQLTFDNRAFTLASLAMTREEKHLPISAAVLFEIFPFCIVFGSDMIVRSIGNSLMVILPDLVGKKITNWFDLVRPLIAFKFGSILNRTNNIFELVTVEPIINDKQHSSDGQRQALALPEEIDNFEDKNLRLKGQMVYMDNWKMMMYLGTPVMPDLNSLIISGLYINDLSMHDFSRDLMLAGTQQSVELKLALDQEQQKSKKLEESMRKLDEEMRRTDELLYQMIPKQVADRLRKGENPIDTCEMFDSVSILFSDVVTFTEICSRITPMEVVSMLNAMYSIFDKLTERNRVYKVETIGDAYMVVSGAPEKEGKHAQRVCDMALDMVDAITDLKDPSTGQHLRIRVGVHSGAVVAGIVGLKMPRYCLFGDSVNTASRMESSSESMKIHISQYTQECLPKSYKISERGEIQIKGKGNMKTYWLQGKDARKPLPKRFVEFSTKENLEKAVVPQQSPLKKIDSRSGIYSPITFEDVAARSIASSPIKHMSNGRECRSNSAGAVHSFCNPADFFGSMVLDHSDFDKLDAISSNQEPFRGRCTTAPPRSLHSSVSAQEISTTSQTAPLTSAPGVLINNLPLAVTCVPQPGTKEASEVETYEFGKCMHIYAKKKCGNPKMAPRASISDGDICGKQGVSMSSSHSQPFSKPNNHHSHQQCCSGFGSGRNQRFQTHACNIV